MNPFYYISATIEIVGALIALTLIISLLLERSARGRLGRIFLSMLICNGACLINDALFWIFVGRPEKYAGAIARVTVFATYAISYIFLPLFIYYALTLIRQSRPASYGVAHTSAAVCTAAFLSLAVSQFNNMYYYFDAQNRYYRGPFFAYSQSVFIFFAVAVAIVIFRYRKALGFRNALCLLSYITMVSAALIIEKFTYGITLVGIFTTFSLFVIYVSIQMKQIRLLRERELELAEGRITAMHSQIQSHFIYNVLTIIRRLCRVDPALAEETVVDFSNYLRGNLNSLSVKGAIPFESELNHVKTYLNLEKKRFGDRLNVEYDIQALDFMVPALSLQTIAENAVRHGINTKEQGGTVSIGARETETEYIITIEDDGAGYDPSGEGGGVGFDPSGANNAHGGAGFGPSGEGCGGVGIENTRSRLALLCGGSLVIGGKIAGVGAGTDASAGVGTIAVITIPKKRDVIKITRQGGLEKDRQGGSDNTQRNNSEDAAG